MLLCFLGICAKHPTHMQYMHIHDAIYTSMCCSSCPPVKLFLCTWTQTHPSPKDICGLILGPPKFRETHLKNRKSSLQKPVLLLILRRIITWMIQQARLYFGSMAGAQQVVGDIGAQIGIPNQEVHFTTSRLRESNVVRLRPGKNSYRNCLQI